MTARSYIQRFALFTLLGVLAIVAINYFVDPYAITGAKRIPGISEYKVDINNVIRMSKRYQPLFNQHSALIVGNSRVELGLNPSHDCFVGQGWSVYNLGLPGAGFNRQLAYALNVMYQQPVERVLLSIDFTDFLLAFERDGNNRPGLQEETSGGLEFLPSGELNPAYFQVRLLDYYKALFSLDALVSSIKTVALQGSHTTDRDYRGFNPARDFAQSVRVEGARVLFDQKNQALDQKYARPWFLRDSEDRPSQAFEDLTAFLSIAQERGIEVIVFTNPFHEEYWSMLARNGLSGLHQEWKEEISRLLGEYRESGVAFWDFSPDSPYIHEQVPARGVLSGPLEWFWEPSHYREQLGDLMIEAMLADSCARPVVFGRKLI